MKRAAIGLALLGCSSAPAPAPPAPAPTNWGAKPPEEKVVSEPAPTASASAAPAAPAIAAPIDDVKFPPPPIAPPVERTAKPGDGAWTPLFDGASIVRTTVHPHAIKGHVYAAVVAIDLRKIELKLVAGTDEPVSKSVPQERRPGLVSVEDHKDLRVVFNGGFMAKHGGFGMMLAGDTFVPPRPDACTVAMYRDGAIRIRSWSELAATAEAMHAWRQTPPCLIEQGALHPLLLSDPDARPWGAAENREREIRRSALGVDASGKVLFYGLGEWVSARMLAEAMKAVGSVDAAELDINWSYTRFLMYRQGEGGAPEVADTLVPKIKHATGEYVKKPARRDFFYLKQRR